MTAEEAPAAAPAVVGGLPCVELQSRDGGRAVVSRLGAQVLSWRPPGGDERLYLSPGALLDGSGPIRGGVPVVFPQFANRGPLPAHGLARTGVWHLKAVADAGGNDQACLTWQDDEVTRRQWPQAFGCEFSVQLDGPTLEMRLQVTNRGHRSLSFEAALHTYLRVDDLSALRLHGLGGAGYQDRSAADRLGCQTDPQLTITGEVDRVYGDAPRQVLVCEPRYRTRVVALGGFSDLVVWNPGAARCARIPDLLPMSFRHLLCVEAARILQPVVLRPGHGWWGGQRLTALAPGS